MPDTTAELVDLLHLEPLEVGLFRGHQLLSNLQRTFGGLVLAQAIAAAYDTVPDERSLHSLHAYFLRPGRVERPILYAVENLRDGHTFSARRVEARQAGKVICQVSASFHIGEPGLDHHDAMPEVPAPDDCPGFADTMRSRFGDSPLWREWDALDVRIAGTSGPGGGIEPRSHGAHMRLWIRTTDGLDAAEGPAGHRLHEAVLAYLSDLSLLSVSTVPHQVAFLSPNLQSASIDHAMWFHRSVRADQWLLYDQVSPSASHALGFSEGRLFQDGALVASTAQEGLIRLVSNG